LHTHTAIIQSIDNAKRKGTSVEETKTRKAELDSIAKDIAALQQKLAQSAFFLPSYDVQQSHKSIKDLQSTLAKTKEQLIPKRKFAFRSRRNKKAAAKTVDAAPVSQAAEQAQSTVSNNADGKSPIAGKSKIVDDAKTQQAAILAHVMNKLEDNVKIHNADGKTIVFKSGDIDGKDVWISNVSDCTIHICDHLGALRMDNVKNCKIHVGAIAGSAHVEYCTNSMFNLALRQLRVHHTTDTVFQLHVLSDPIIEDTTRVQFAPYNLNYDGIQQHLKRAGLDTQQPSANRWDQVKDFNWLRSQQSPNWSLIPEADRADAVTIEP
jgi:tubulin-specific chaperone C